VVDLVLQHVPRRCVVLLPGIWLLLPGMLHVDVCAAVRRSSLPCWLVPVSRQC
jgi:hypothetical protein